MLYDVTGNGAFNFFFILVFDCSRLSLLVLDSFLLLLLLVLLLVMAVPLFVAVAVMQIFVSHFDEGGIDDGGVFIHELRDDISCRKE